ncbi:hypothetical protein AY601_5050 [Pedobacter cryoconitis]|uniref:Uncharacterized protein n=1 Tax=Pedobacter cryoconitis TaxID=188932 RepID=A0A127VKN1_9SPHI|nr:hypothetical protein AY601_5050 [Pedobacter cryoconitis]
MFSDKTLKELVYPTLRAILFGICVPVSFICNFFYLGTSKQFDKLIKENPMDYVLGKLAVFLFLIALFSLLLFIIEKICKIKVTIKPYLWLMLIPFCFFLFTLSALF